MSLVENESLIVSGLELRASETDDSPGTVVGQFLPIGRIASDRREVFTPGAAMFPSDGVKLLISHGGEVIMMFEPIVVEDGYNVEAVLPSSPSGIQAAELVRTGKRSALSVEFRCLEAEIVSQVREVRSALVEAVALVPSPAYEQARAELRGRAPLWWF